MPGELSSHRDALIGSLLGTAVGDALGLPYEGVSRRRAGRLFGPPDRYRLLPRRGMVSDDTEHACIVAQSLIAAGEDAEEFTRQLARRLRRWLLCLPAGTGLATVKAILRLCVGVSPDRSGVWSAGNGPAMRSPILGTAVTDAVLLRRYVSISSRITHSDPAAEHGAWAIALAARIACRESAVEPGVFAEELRQSLAGESAEELLALIDQAVGSRERNETTQQFAAAIGCENGVSGWILHTVPVVLHAWFCFPTDFRAGVTTVIECGGDTDSTAAILGGLIGCRVGKAGIPAEWLDRLWEWPRTVAWMEHLADVLATCNDSGVPQRLPELPMYQVVPRNLFFLAVVLVHGFRRLLPPY